MKYFNMEGYLNTKDNDTFSGNIKVSGPVTIPYCDVCGKDLDDEEFTPFMYKGTVHHMCENCHKNGCMSIFK
ncbi:MAG: hypothetical protein ACI4PR_04620 [Acutalibacteraceae bacterium]